MHIQDILQPFSSIFDEIIFLFYEYSLISVGNVPVWLDEKQKRWEAVGVWVIDELEHE